MTAARRRGRQVQPKRRIQISEEFAHDISNLIVEWRGPLTWARVVAEAERVCGHTWTRQGLQNHAAIKKAYQDKTKALKNRRPVQEGDIATTILLEKIEHRDIEIGKLRARINAYDEMFIRYQANAHRLGIAPGELDQPLPPVHRRGQHQAESDGA